jgi:hypothetical protein
MTQRVEIYGNWSDKKRKKNYPLAKNLKDVYEIKE